MGTPAAAACSLKRLLQDGHDVVAVYTQPDRPAGRGNKIAFSPVKRLALESGLPVFQPVKIKTQEAIDIFRSHRADMVVVVAYGRILPESFLQAFPKGAINVHFSLLPKYRGAAPVNWAIVNGENKNGVTTMRMDAGLDTGDILLIKETVISPQETAPELMDRLAVIGADLLSETLSNFDRLLPRPQNHSDATFAPIMKREDGRIDWTMGADKIANRIRGFQPFPGSFTSFGSRKITIWSAKPILDVEVSTEPAGRIIEAQGDSLIIACGDGTALLVEELQVEGKRKMNVRDILNGTSIKVGETLGGGTVL